MLLVFSVLHKKGVVPPVMVYLISGVFFLMVITLICIVYGMFSAGLFGFA